MRIVIKTHLHCFLFILGLMLLMVFVAQADTETPSPEPTPTMGMECVPVDNSIPYTFQPGRQVDPRWANECAPELLNPRMFGDTRTCEWQIVNRPVTETPTPQVTATPSFTTCGESIQFPDWEVSNTNFCAQFDAYRLADGSFSNCVGRTTNWITRIVGMSLFYEFGQDNLQTISNLEVGLSQLSHPQVFSVELRRCDSPITMRCGVEHWSTQTANTEFSVTNVYAIRVFFSAQIGTTAQISVEDAKDWVVVNSIRFCATSAMFAPIVPTPTPTPLVTPNPNSDCGQSEVVVRLTGGDCDLSSPVVAFLNSMQIDLDDYIVPDIGYINDCGSAGYQFVTTNTYRHEITIQPALGFFVRGASFYFQAEYEGSSSPPQLPSIQFGRGSAMIFRQPITNGFNVVQFPESSEWDGYISDIVISYSSIEPQTVITLDTLTIVGSFYPPCPTEFNCAVVSYIDEVPAFSGADLKGFGFTDAGLDCQTLIPKIDLSPVRSVFGWLIGNVADFDGLQICFQLYNFPTLTIFGVAIDTIYFAYISFAIFTFKYLLTR